MVWMCIVGGVDVYVGDNVDVYIVDGMDVYVVDGVDVHSEWCGCV